MNEWSSVLLYSLGNAIQKAKQTHTDFMRKFGLSIPENTKPEPLEPKKTYDLGLTGRGYRAKKYERWTSKSQWKAQFQEQRIRSNLSLSAPIRIPYNSLVKVEYKTGYKQIKFRWNEGNYVYRACWHTRTPNVPSWLGNTWVIERTDKEEQTSSILMNKNGWTPKQEPNERRMSKPEWKAQYQEQRIRSNLALSAPIRIPCNSSVKVEYKTGYKQIKFQWSKGNYEYLARWHTRTPNAPSWLGNTWVIERTDKEEQTSSILTNKNVWTPKEEWHSAIQARKRGKANDKQYFLLKIGHWTAS